jgi:sugar O-acyltransferase (sialic acid O-acetyltransferase NeuD family)
MKSKFKKVVVFGAGGHGKVVLDILLESKVPVAGFIDDNPAVHGTKILGYPVLGGWSYLTKNKKIGLALGIGNNKIRRKIFEKAVAEKITVVSALHPQSVVSRFSKIGAGVVVMAGAVINPGVVIEEGVVVNTSASVDHDCYLKKFSHIWPGARLAGTVTVGEETYIGTGVSVIQNITIGKNVLVGAGAAVVEDIPDGVTAVGVPAQVIKRNA